ncbi:hypothetical protein O988_03858 [Pseudogymnoascus sp. VKM F-3808]|nr:hypothetical protein O988_03858 [Pseudogymnoascus sp. VKM F-3808]
MDRRLRGTKRCQRRVDGHVGDVVGHLPHGSRRDGERGDTGSELAIASQDGLGGGDIGGMGATAGVLDAGDKCGASSEGILVLAANAGVERAGSLRTLRVRHSLDGIGDGALCTRRQRRDAALGARAGLQRCNGRGARIIGEIVDDVVDGALGAWGEQREVRQVGDAGRDGRREAWRGGDHGVWVAVYIKDLARARHVLCGSAAALVADAAGDGLYNGGGVVVLGAGAGLKSSDAGGAGTLSEMVKGIAHGVHGAGREAGVEGDVLVVDILRGGAGW